MVGNGDESPCKGGMVVLLSGIDNYKTNNKQKSQRKSIKTA